jgi:N-acetylglutamate synthase-like GNAT family acetyltransferase
LKNKKLETGFYISEEEEENKINPFIRFAKKEDSETIAEIFMGVYKGTYPYMEMEDSNAIRKMIEAPDFWWIVFTYKKRIIGCMAIHIDLDNKAGTLHGFVLRSEYQGLINTLKLSSACMYPIFEKYHKKILVWHCEVRSAHNKSQIMIQHLHFIPVAFLPQKDLFFHKEESEFIYIIYDKSIFSRYRNSQQPQIPLNPQALRCYLYSQKYFNLGYPRVFSSNQFSLKNSKIRDLKLRLIKRYERDYNGNINVTFSFKGKKSFLKFFHNALIRNAEKTEFKVNSLEELFVLVSEVDLYIKKNDLRYFEIHIPAYKQKEQLIFINAGFEVFGYIPAFKYNRDSGLFDDYFIYVKYINNINLKGLAVLKESKELITNIKPYWTLNND